MASRKTGIEGLDRMLKGGIPDGLAVLLLAPPGSGKTTLCNRFAAETLSKKKKVVYISTAYSFERLQEVMKKAGCAHDPRYCAFVDCYTWRQPGENPPAPENVTIMDSITDLNELARAMMNSIKALGGVDSIILDSASDLVIYSDPTSVYKFLQIVHGEVTKNKAVGIVALEFGLHEEKVNNTISYIFDGVIEMETNGKRKLRVAKMSGVAHAREWAEFEIKPKLKIEVAAT